MQKEITIVDRGRGPQLSTSRITVQNLVPYFQEGWSVEEILRWVPALTATELQVVRQYFEENKEEVLEVDRQIRERNAQQRNSPEVEKILQEARVERLALMEELRQRKNANGVEK